MARIGTFTGPSFEWRKPLSIVHPVDNKINGYQFHESLRLNMDQYTAEELRDLEQQIRELEAVMRMDQDQYAWR